MMISAWIVLGLLATHFVGDFALQSDWMATYKSKQWDVLALHCSIYAACFIWAAHPAVFLLITFVSHFITDAITSRITSKLWFFAPHKGDWFQVNSVELAVGIGPKPFVPYVSDPWTAIAGKRHWFFVMIGLDQLIHFTTLGATWIYLTRF